MRVFLTVIGMAAHLSIVAGAAQSRDSTRVVAVYGPDCVARGPARLESAASDTVCLTREEAVAAAVIRNPQIAAAREQVAQARARLVQGVAIPDPAASYAVDHGQSHDKILSAQLSVPFPDKFRLHGKIGRADIEAFEANLRQLQQLIAAQASETYDSVLAAIRHRVNLQEGKRLADDFLAKTEARYQAGTTARLDVIKAKVDVAQAENDLIVSERDVANARASLNRLIDRPLAAPVAVSDSLAIPPDLPPLDTLEATALAGRPELTALARQQEGAHATTGLARQYWLPDFTLGLSHNYDDPGPGIITIGLALPLPVFFWQHSKGEIAESRHHEAELAASYRDLRGQVGLDVRTAYATALTSRRQAIFIRDQLLPSAREAFRIAFTSYGLGGLSALEVLDARRGLRDAENQFTDALAAASMARADLERAVGRPLDSFATGGSHD